MMIIDTRGEGNVMREVPKIKDISAGDSGWTRY
jgi:hypothetical protein